MESGFDGHRRNRLVTPVKNQWDNEQKTNQSESLEKSLAKVKGKGKENARNVSSNICKKTGMSFVEERGLRRYGPPLNFVGNPPTCDSEVFVGQLPEDCYEPELIPVFERVGKIFEMRLMMKVSGNTRGFCFVRYYNPVDAERAINELNNFEIRIGWEIDVVKSINKKTLFLRHIPVDKDESELETELHKIAVGVVRVSAPKPEICSSENKNRGFAFIEFETHRFATEFLKFAKKHVMWENTISVQWADSSSDMRSILVSNLSADISEARLRSMFNKVSNNGVVRVEKILLCASICFQSRYQAQKARKSMNNQVVDGFPIKIIMSTGFMNDLAFAETAISAPAPLVNSVTESFPLSISNEPMNTNGFLNENFGSSSENSNSLMGPLANTTYLCPSNIQPPGQDLYLPTFSQYVPPIIYQGQPIIVNTISHGVNDYGNFLASPTIILPCTANSNVQFPMLFAPCSFFYRHT